MTGMTILVADDDRKIRESVAKILKLNGYHVIEAADGLEALELATHYPDSIELLLTDVGMPHMQGPELCRRMQSKFPEIRMVFMSGYADLELAPGVAFLEKPFSAHELLATVSEALVRIKGNPPVEAGRRSQAKAFPAFESAPSPRNVTGMCPAAESSEKPCAGFVSTTASPRGKE
jgi:CheY-like chemotaxis protein